MVGCLGREKQTHNYIYSVVPEVHISSQGGFAFAAFISLMSRLCSNEAEIKRGANREEARGYHFKPDAITGRT